MGLPSQSDAETVPRLRRVEFEAIPDGRAYGYSWHRSLSDLYLVEGLT